MRLGGGDRSLVSMVKRRAAGDRTHFFILLSPTLCLSLSLSLYVSLSFSLSFFSLSS